MFFFNLIYFVFLPFLIGCSMYGWGSIILNNRFYDYISINIIFGMSTTLFLGGLLNFFHLANYKFINIIFFIGLLLFLLKIYKNFKTFKLKQFFKKEIKVYIALIIPLFLLAFHIISFTKLNAHNYHDDYQMYFVHPIKMLETGSFYGSTLSSIGQATLGGQAFFQSFFISWFGIGAINIFDSIFCLSICVLLIIEISFKQKIPIFGILISCLFFLINPQVVNVSSVYSAILFMMGCVVVSIELIRNYELKNSLNFKIILTLSVFLSSLAILKNSYLLFCFVYFLSFILSIFIFGLLKQRLFHNIVAIPFLGLLHLLPWTISILMNYRNSMKFTNEPIPRIGEILLNNSPNLFSFELLFYGGNLFQYTSLILIGISFIFFVLLFLKNKDIDFAVVAVGFSTIISGMIVFFLILFVVGPNNFQSSSFIRHSIPFVIATIPIGILLLYSILHEKLKYTSTVSSIVILLISLNFLPIYKKRISQIYKCGSQLSFTNFACSENYINYSKSIINKDKQLLTLEWQKYIPESKSVTAWINTPFFLDFKRNEIIEIDIAGLDNDWVIFPSTEYMIWEHTGFATRSLKDLRYTAKNGPRITRRHSIRSLQLIRKLNNFYEKGKIKLIYNNDNVSIFKFK